MPFWTVEDAGPYKSSLNILMRTTVFGVRFFVYLSSIISYPAAFTIRLNTASPTPSREGILA